MSGPKSFPNVRTKLSAPAKKSAFEKQRMEAEAKRQREEAETAAVYKDFVASFDEDPPDGPPSSGSSGFRGGFRGSGGFNRGGSGSGRRHFSGGGGPPGRGGTFGRGLSGGFRKRTLDSAFERDEEEVAGVFGGLPVGSGGIDPREKRRMREANTGLLAFENSGPVLGLPGRSKRKEAVQDDSDSDSGKSHPKPTVLLGSLPPNISKNTITNLLSATNLKIDSIRIIPAPPPPGPSVPSPSIRKAATALVTLSTDTPSSGIDSAVSLLNGKYIGFGFWLTIVRHLSSTVAGSAPSIPTLGSQSNPFGAREPPPTGPTGVGRGGPHRGGFAPPTSFQAAQRSHSSGGAQVHVQPPQDLKVLKLIHRTVENLLTHGPAFEALLMSKDEVRNDEKFAWLWDARSSAGVYYRWKVWEIVTGYSIDKTQVPMVEMFEGGGGVGNWVPPKKTLKYEFAGSLKDVVDDEGFMSDELDEDHSDGEDHTDRPVGLQGGEGKKARGYLGVLERAKLIHLISRMPTQTSKVRRGDVARVMAFAMEHAEGGMGEEVVDVLVANILKPLSFTTAAKPISDYSDSDSETDTKPPATSDPTTNSSDPPDTSSAKIVALWLVSDVLSNSSLGVRAAWRYRQLFDTALREREVFRHLGSIYKGSGWGRMKAEKFRRGVVEGVLQGWEKWCIFPQTSQDIFLDQFLNPYPEKKGNRSVDKDNSEREGSATAAAAAPVVSSSGGSRWKTVEAEPSVFRPDAPPAVTIDDDEDIDGVPLIDSDVDGEPLIDSDVDGDPMIDSDVDGEPMIDSDVDGEPMVEDEPEGKGKQPMHPHPRPAEEKEMKQGLEAGNTMKGFSIGGGGSGGGAGGGGLTASKRKRPKAEDMFADSD